MIDLHKFAVDAAGLLNKHGPDPILGFLLFVAFLIAVGLGWNPLLDVTGLVIVWGGYHVRSCYRERHRERLAETRVRALETGRGKQVRRKYQKKAVKKVQPPAGTAPVKDKP